MTVTRVPASNPGPEEMPYEPVLRTLCLELSDDLSLPLQCRFLLNHANELHSWQIEKGLGEYRAKRLREEQDTPSGRLPVRTPGAALEEEREVTERWMA